MWGTNPSLTRGLNRSGLPRHACIVPKKCPPHAQRLQRSLTPYCYSFSMGVIQQIIQIQDIVWVFRRRKLLLCNSCGLGLLDYMGCLDGLVCSVLTCKIRGRELQVNHRQQRPHQHYLREKIRGSSKGVLIPMPSNEKNKNPNPNEGNKEIHNIDVFKIPITFQIRVS